MFHTILTFCLFPQKQPPFLKNPLPMRRSCGKIQVCEYMFRSPFAEMIFWRNLEMQLFITIMQLLCGLCLILVVLFQSGKSAGLSGSIGGVADSFLAKNKAKTADAKLARATKWIGGVFIVLTLALNVI